MDTSLGSLLLPNDIRERAFERLTRWTALSSPSSDSAGLDRMARMLASEAEAMGLSTRIESETGEDGQLLPVVEIRGGDGFKGGDRPLLLFGHFDTVLSATSPRREGSRLVATGAIDMKGGLVAFFGALELLAQRGSSSPGFVLIVTPDEEVGGAISRRRVERHGPEARALWVLEPGEPVAAGETIVAGRRGLFHWRLEAAGKAAHSGAHFWDGRSAIAAAAEWCTAAAALSRPHHGPTVNAARFLGGDRRLVEDPAASAALFGTARELNVVPNRVVVEGEARFLRAEDESPLHDALHAAAERLAESHGVEIRFHRGARIAPVDPVRSGRDWIDRAVASASAAGWKLEVEEDRGGVSFPNFLPDPGRIPVLDGLGPVGGGMHTREEFVDLASLERRIALLADLLEQAASE